MSVETNLLLPVPISILLGAGIAIFHLALLHLALIQISKRQRSTGLLLKMSFIRVVVVVILLYFVATHLDAISLMLLFASFIAVRMILVPIVTSRKFSHQN